MSGAIPIAIGPGELIDKITILEIKSARITDPIKLENVRAELQALNSARDRFIRPSTEIARLTGDLSQTNQALWEVEDEIRQCESRGEFGPRFIELARSVYNMNDQRAALKKQINLALGSELIEEKSYQ